MDRAVRAVGARHGVTDLQRRWLERIRAEIKARVVVDGAALDEPPSPSRAGHKRINKSFTAEIDTILQEIAAET